MHPTHIWRPKVEEKYSPNTKEVIDFMSELLEKQTYVEIGDYVTKLTPTQTSPALVISIAFQTLLEQDRIVLLNSLQ